MTPDFSATGLDSDAMDPRVRACDDFYRHANGHWLAAHEIPADRPIDGAFHALRDQSEERARALAEDAAAGRLNDPDAHLIAALWTRFMDEARADELGVSPIAARLTEIDACATRTDLAAIVGSLMAEGVPSFFGVYVGTDPHDSDSHILSVVQSGLGLPDESYYSEDAHAPIRDAYVAHLKRMIALADLANDADATASALMNLETSIASHHRDSVSNRNPLLSDNPRSWAELQGSASGFDWSAWAQAVGLDLADDAILNIDQPDFLAAATELWATTDLETLKTYTRMALLGARADLLSTPIVEANFDFYGRTLSGTQELRPRWKRALSLIEGCVGESLGRAWVARYFPPSAKQRMDALVDGLLGAYERAISGAAWMGQETKTRALDKLATFRPKIGYPPKWKDMSGLAFDAEDSLVDCVAAANRHETAREWEKLARPVDRDEWLMTPQTVNAYYNPTLNEIVFPAAILQPPFFDEGADEAVNFGAIGAVIGHEIGHGFDDQGSRFDARGNLENWWADADRERFEETTRALIAQYDALTPSDLEGVEGAHVNGALTIGENIGDLGGLSIAWSAWLASLAARGLTPGTVPVIDGLTGAQRFFYSWARVWRTAARKEFAAQMLTVDPHSPAEFRCNQILKNIDGFHEAFATAPGDGMWLDAAERVRIW